MKERISEPSPAIAKILFLARMLPADIEVEDPAILYQNRLAEDLDGRLSRICEVFNVVKGTEVLDGESSEKQELFALEMRRAANSYQRDALTSCCAKLPEDFIEYVAIDSSVESNFYWFQEFYVVSADELGLSLDSVLQQCEESPELRETVSYTAATERLNGARKMYESIYELLIYLEQYKESEFMMMFRPQPRFFNFTGVRVVEGRLRFTADEFTNAFDDFEIDRLGRCGYCRKVFWKRRLDMKGCTRLCAKSLRTRKWREKMTPAKRDLYKINRIRKSLDK